MVDVVTDSSYGSISRSQAGHVVAKALTHAAPTIMLQQFGLKQPMPTNKGVTIYWRRPKTFPVNLATLALSEGVTPDAQAFDYDRANASLSQYGAVSMITDVVGDTNEDPVMMDCAEMMGEQAGLTSEMVVWGELKAGTNVKWSSSQGAAAAAITDVDQVLTNSMQSQAVRDLKNQKGRKFTSVIEGTIKVGTRPVEPAFVAVAHTDCEDDIRALTGFKPVSDYASMKPICPEEIGSVKDVRYILSAELSATGDAGALASGTGLVSSGTKVDVYPVIYMAKEAFGVVPLSGKSSLEPTIINPGKKTKSDPLGQRGYSGWKTWLVAKILNDNWIVQCQVGVSDLY